MQENGPKAGELSRTAARRETGRGEARQPEDIGAILDALPAVIGYYGADLRNRLANRAYVEFFGVTPDEDPRSATSAR